MTPTRAFVYGILKYKTLHGQFENPENHFIYDEQKSYVDFVFNGVRLPDELTAGKKLNAFRSVECQIMDWSDDAAYSLNDLADGIHSGFINKDKIERWAGEQSLSPDDTRIVDELLAAIADRRLEKVIAGKIGKFIQACSVSKRENFMSEATNRYRFQVGLEPAIQKEAEIYKRISIDLVFRSPQLHQL